MHCKTPHILFHTMDYAENILGTIGNTPLVKINKLAEEIPGLVLAKYETFNPGNSTKDRMALQMINDAEADGRLKPGATIIEGTSGNTGMGLALAAIVKGYKMVCVISDKQSKEKVDILRAVGRLLIPLPAGMCHLLRSLGKVPKLLLQRCEHILIILAEIAPKISRHCCNTFLLSSCTCLRCELCS